MGTTLRIAPATAGLLRIVRLKTTVTLLEEAYQHKLEGLQDRGESEPDKSSVGLADSPDDDDDDQTEN